MSNDLNEVNLVNQLNPEAKPFVPVAERVEKAQLNPEAKPFVPSSSKAKTIASDLHPCVNCGKACKGKQCRDCHLKMIQSKCIDCDNSFNARRKDGTMRKRCVECQDSYTEKYIKKCPECETDFHDLSGKYKSCLPCYKNQQEVKKAEYEKREAEREAKRKEAAEKWDKEKKACYSRGCKNMTIYKFCKPCNDDKKYMSNNFMTYTCQDCGYRGKGDYKLCRDCA